MKGNNEIIVNSATLVAMAQEYFDKRLLEGHRIKILSVETVGSQYANQFKFNTGEPTTVDSL